MNYFVKEVIRCVLFLLIVIFYLTTKIGVLIGLVHLFLVFRYPQKYGMSKILLAIFDKKN